LPTCNCSVKTVWSTSERFRGELLTMARCTNLCRLPLPVLVYILPYLVKCKARQSVHNHSYKSHDKLGITEQHIITKYSFTVLSYQLQSPDLIPVDYSIYEVVFQCGTLISWSSVWLKHGHERIQQSVINEATDQRRDETVLMRVANTLNILLWCAAP